VHGLGAGCIGVSNAAARGDHALSLPPAQPQAVTVQTDALGGRCVFTIDGISRVAV
jgi:hypothetical protein